MTSTTRVGVAVIFICTAYACAHTKPTTRNVLSGANHSTQSNHQKDTDDATVGNKKSKKLEIDPATLIPGSAAYYAYKTDSAQEGFARKAYVLNVDSIIEVISEIPSEKNNAAITNNQFYATPNFNMRKPGFVIIHHTNQRSKEETLYTFSVKHSGVSAHYVIGKDGMVYQMLNDYLRSWHAGRGKWGSIVDMNSYSIGIELDNNGIDEPFADVQIDGLIKLLTILKKKYDIPTANFIGHADFAAGRKDDPSPFFPWKKLAEAGFGYWYDVNNLKEPPTDFNALLALRVIGYDISNPAKAAGAFKLHFIQTDLTETLTDYDIKVLYNLYLEY